LVEQRLEAMLLNAGLHARRLQAVSPLLSDLPHVQQMLLSERLPGVSHWASPLSVATHHSAVRQDASKVLQNAMRRDDAFQRSPSRTTL
jgi:hypothetical protein